jgi:WD40 repeat protein
MVKVWNISDIKNPTCVHTHQSHSQWIRAISLSLDTKTVYVVDGESIEVWSTVDHTCLQTFSGNYGYQVRNMIQYQVKRILSIEINDKKKGMLKVLDLSTNRSISQIKAHDTEINSIAFFHGGQMLYTIGVKDSIIKVWSL